MFSALSRERVADSPISKEEWMNRFNGHQITRADMNTLIMNYLVTGCSLN